MRLLFPVLMVVAAPPTLLVIGLTTDLITFVDELVEEIVSEDSITAAVVLYQIISRLPCQLCNTNHSCTNSEVTGRADSEVCSVR